MAGQPSLPPGAVWVPAPGGTRPPNLLVLFHGRGDGPAPFARLAAKLALPNTAGLALRGPVPLGPGHAWCEDGDDDAAEAASLAARRPALAAALDGTGWPRHRVHLFGYGDGGMAALDLTVAAAAGALGPGPDGSHAGGRRFGSVVTVGGALPVAALVPADFRGGPAGGAPPPGSTTPVLMTRGEADSDLPAPLAAASLTALKTRLGCPDASLHTVPGAAGGMLGRDEAEVRAVMRHWARCLSGPVPAGCVEVE